MNQNIRLFRVQRNNFFSRKMATLHLGYTYNHIHTAVSGHEYSVYSPDPHTAGGGVKLTNHE